MTKILIVEDNELNRDMLSRRLTRKGYEIEMAEDGALGLQAIKSHADIAYGIVISQLIIVGGPLILVILFFFGIKKCFELYA